MKNGKKRQRNPVSYFEYSDDLGPTPGVGVVLGKNEKHVG